MRIANNIQSLNVLNRQKINGKNTSKAMEKLSSGLRISKAADDAAGLSISQKMRAQIRGLNQASKNAQDGISLIQTAEGALGEMHSLTQRIRELCVQGANSTLTDDDRDKIQLELDELKAMVKAIRNIELALGSSVKKPSKSEIPNMQIARKSIVAKTEIKKGDKLSEENITIKRPGNGINPMRWDEVVGTIAAKDYKEDELI